MMEYTCKVYLILLVFGISLLSSESKKTLPRSNFPRQAADECSEMICDVNAACRNETGSGSCVCNVGWMGNGTVCTDIDECTDSVCDKYANCNNVEGSFTCTCHDGWSGNGTACIDIDECSSIPCDIHANCTNVDGGFNCVCNEGWSGDGFICGAICSNDVCDPYAECKNPTGDSTCVCSEGWTGNGITCNDIDECSSDVEGSHSICDTNAKCTNEPGGFVCTCNEGWSGNGFTSCTDIDECSSRNTCDGNATCQNEVGSYRCTCNNGWAGTGFVCVDVDECYNGICDDNANCMNKPGSYICTCNEGWVGNGKVCEDVNECSNEICDVNADCINGQGSYVCLCKEGWTGNGFVCTEIEVITCEDNPCMDPQSWCIDHDESYECPCKPGFYLPTLDPISCLQGLKFGSTLFLAGNTKADETTQTQVTRFLRRAYVTSNGFVSINVIEGSTNSIWDYELIYSRDSGASEDLISAWFADYLSTEYACDVDSNSCVIDLFDGTSFELDAKESVQNAGSVDGVVCSSFEQYCDSESTRCNSIDGYATCQCLEGYVQTKGAERSCTRKICNLNSDCNTPFGWCEPDYNDNEGRCICMFGFEGSHCYSPWLFVFIIVGGILLLTVILTTFLACRSSSKTKVLPIQVTDYTQREALPKNGSTNTKAQDNQTYIQSDF